MENASKALIMAGSVLIALIIISLLVAFFGQLRNLQNTTDDVEKEEQVYEFNKQYDVYARNVYGSELLSLANKIIDYNKTESENDGYTKIELYITIKNDIDSTYLKKGEYTSNSFIKELNNIEKKVEEIGNITIKSSENSKNTRKVSKLATMRTSDIEELGFTQEQYKDLVNQYNRYKSLISEIKAKVFTYENFEYDSKTGRIIKMNYKV